MRNVLVVDGQRGPSGMVTGGFLVALIVVNYMDVIEQIGFQPIRKEVMKMSLMLIFNRKVIPIANGEKGAGRVECQINGYVDSDSYEIGHINFPTKQSWTKFWGAVQRGAMNVPDMEVKMFNVPLEEGAEGDPQPVVEVPNQEPQKRWVGNSLVDQLIKDDTQKT